MKILFVSSEVYPFAKTGGLADVAYALPKMLRKSDSNYRDEEVSQEPVDARIILPKYGSISENFTSKLIHIANFGVPVGWRNQYCGLQFLNYKSIPVYFIDNEYYFKRESFYGDFDDGERFSFFCRAVLESIKYMDGFMPDVIHCNDWQTGMIPLLLKVHYSHCYWNVKTVYTIHNLKYQGVYSPEILTELLCLDMSYYDEGKCKYHDGISFMKSGINYCDAITTVSPSYAEEVQTPYYGEGLNGLLCEKREKLQGIVNGIDYDEFNPSRDENIFEKYSLKNYKLKINNKLELQREFAMPVDLDTPMISIVSRLVKQKGLDLMTCIIDELLEMDIQMVILGSGDIEYTDFFEYYSKSYPSKLHVYWGYSDQLARKIYAASDMFLMPSQFEPCGIGQLISMRYGTVPIVRETGGLKDTVIPYNAYTNEGIGFSFANFNAHEMLDTIRTAAEVYKDKKAWSGLVRRAMKTDFSWKQSALKYIDLYNYLL